MERRNEHPLPSGRSENPIERHLPLLGILGHRLQGPAFTELPITITFIGLFVLPTMAITMLPNATRRCRGDLG